MEQFNNILTNEITINILVGFFYSALFGLILYVITNTHTKLDQLKEMKIDLIKYTFASNSITLSLIRLANLNGKEYRRYFGDILDNKNVDINDYNNIHEYIMFDKIPELPELNKYLVHKFIQKTTKLYNNLTEFIELLKKTNE